MKRAVAKPLVFILQGSNSQVETLGTTSTSPAMGLAVARRRTKMARPS
jgi:hypothetical protein